MDPPLPSSHPPRRRAGAVLGDVTNQNRGAPTRSAKKRRPAGPSPWISADVQIINTDEAAEAEPPAQPEAHRRATIYGSALPSSPQRLPATTTATATAAASAAPDAAEADGEPEPDWALIAQQKIEFTESLQFWNQFDDTAGPPAQPQADAAYPLELLPAACFAAPQPAAHDGLADGGSSTFEFVIEPCRPAPRAGRRGSAGRHQTLAELAALRSLDTTSPPVAADEEEAEVVRSGPGRISFMLVAALTLLVGAAIGAAASPLLAQAAGQVPCPAGLRQAGGPELAVLEATAVAQDAEITRLRQDGLAVRVGATDAANAKLAAELQLAECTAAAGGEAASAELLNLRSQVGEHKAKLDRCMASAVESTNLGAAADAARLQTAKSDAAASAQQCEDLVKEAGERNAQGLAAARATVIEQKATIDGQGVRFAAVSKDLAWVRVANADTAVPPLTLAHRDPVGKWRGQLVVQINSSGDG